MIVPQVGGPAPDFDLRDQHGAPVRLSGMRGRVVLLVFFPFAFTTVCTSELAQLRTEVAGREGDGLAVLAISCDPMFSLRVFADREGIGFALLSDFWPHGAVARAYGVFDPERGCPLRGTFVIDREGLVHWCEVVSDGRDISQWWPVLDELMAA